MPAIRDPFFRPAPKATIRRINAKIERNNSEKCRCDCHFDDQKVDYRDKPPDHPAKKCPCRSRDGLGISEEHGLITSRAAWDE